VNRVKDGARKLASLLAARDGVTALEFALVSPALVLLLIGAVDLSRAHHTRSALQSAVEQAARCAAVDSTQCGTEANIKAYAAGRMPSANIPASAFSTVLTTCGRQVSASTNFSLHLPYPAPSTVTLTARSCYPT